LQTKRTLFAALLVLNALATSALGIWQLERRSWKLDLIATVTARVRAPAVPAPGPVEWPRITAGRDAYRHVRVTGRFDHARETMVWAVTGRGEGHWLVTPLYTPQGWTVLINRGFVPAAAAGASRPDGPVAISGLLRMTEPGGSFLRR
jgi:surfeit locus 1 family protein